MPHIVKIILTRGDSNSLIWPFDIQIAAYDIAYYVLVNVEARASAWLHLLIDILSFSF